MDKSEIMSGNKIMQEEKKKPRQYKTEKTIACTEQKHANELEEIELFCKLLFRQFACKYRGRRPVQSPVHVPSRRHGSEEDALTSEPSDLQRCGAGGF